MKRLDQSSPAQRMLRLRAGRTFIAFALLGAGACAKPEAVDSARAQGRQPSDFPEVAVDAFQAMDGGVTLTPDEVKGRNTWMMWTAGNAEFWDWMARYGYGTIDLLRTLDSRGRSTRFARMGLVNEPGFRAAPRPDTLGVWLDEPVDATPSGIDPRVYGRASGIVGLRLFPNPAFDSAAAKRWNADRYYGDPNYYNDRTLVRPYMVGMACAFCHVSYNPVSPPADPENPKWDNLSTYIGNQYFRASAVFAPAMSKHSFVYQLMRAMRDGTLDTSLLATDDVFNPSNMNGIFNVGARLSAATEEHMAGGTLNLKGEQSVMRVPHILKDGADGVGILGALSRVFVNIGEFHQEWLRDHNVLVGGTPQHPFEVAKAQRNSVYWVATESRVENLAKFFLRAARPMSLADAPGGKAYLTRDESVLTRGRTVFGERCAQCHSSKRPPPGVDPTSPEGKAWFRQSAQAPDFQTDNFLSNDQRYPVSLIKTNACRALATNATRGHVWDNFSSETYKTSPPSDPIDVYNPFDGTTRRFEMPGGGPGYYRVPSLISLWASAPFFHNNALGMETRDASVKGRMKAFDDAAEKLLWPAKRLGLASISRTVDESWLQIPAPYLPEVLRSLADSGYLRIGPIPAGTPVNLLGSANITLSDPKQIPRLVKTALKTKNDLIKIKLQHLTADQTRALLANLVPDLLAISKCPDFVEDRGHEFGTDLSDTDKRSLIEFLKTL
jgi:hypothetical protein